MHPDPDPVAAALVRMLAARAGVSGVGLFEATVQGARCVAATEAFLAMGEQAAPPAPAQLPGALAPAGANAARLDPARIGLKAAFAATMPVPGSAGPASAWLVLADPRPRRLTPARLAGLADAAELAATILGSQRARGASRRSAARRVEAALGSRRRGAGDTSLLLLDLDRFRSVNAALGASVGDALLAAIGQRLQAAVGPAGRLLRLDGDRFAVVVQAYAVTDLRALGRRLLQAVAQPVSLDGHTLIMQASIGIVPQAGQVPAAILIMQADAALRRAKAEGRNRIALHEAAAAVAARETSRLELDLAGALPGGQMALAFQPYVDLADGRVSGVEALVRWRHPTRGDLLPASFIPMAEATGQILALGRWVLRTALSEAAGWPDRLHLAVNISPLQFQQPGFLAGVDAALAETGFPADRLELEITETVLMRDNPQTTAQLRALIARGIRIALDDFGTGYSALAYLARLPHHRIKLDKAFVQDLANPATADLIRAIIALARARGIAVTAEGVERPDHLAQVRRMGFTHAQGWAIGAPVADPSGLIAEPLLALP